MGFYKFRKTGKREEIFEPTLEQVGSLISQTSDSQAADHAMKMSRRYLDRMRDKKKELQELEEEKQEIEKRQKEIRQKWETEEISFDDL